MSHRPLPIFRERHTLIVIPLYRHCTKCTYNCRLDGSWWDRLRKCQGMNRKENLDTYSVGEEILGILGTQFERETDYQTYL